MRHSCQWEQEREIIFSELYLTGYGLVLVCVETSENYVITVCHITTEYHGII